MLVLICQSVIIPLQTQSASAFMETIDKQIISVLCRKWCKQAPSVKKDSQPMYLNKSKSTVVSVLYPSCQWYAANKNIRSMVGITPTVSSLRAMTLGPAGPWIFGTLLLRCTNVIHLIFKC